MPRSSQLLIPTVLLLAAGLFVVRNVEVRGWVVLFLVAALLLAVAILARTRHPQRSKGPGSQ